MSRASKKLRTLAVCPLTALALFGSVAGALPAHANYAQAQAILEGGTLGGTRGLRVRRIGAPVAFSLNGSFVYYPASSLKVLQHLYAMTRVQAGSWNLATTNSSVCTNGDNCGPVLNSQAACSAGSRILSSTLSNMMKNSSNPDTNAVQQLVGTTTFPMIPPFNANMAGFGRQVMNQFAQNTVGLTNTAINNKFGCEGFCGNPSPNRLTLVDAERLYTAIATDAAVLAPAQRLPLHDLMLNESNTFLNAVIDAEAAATGKNAYKAAFRDQLFMIYKDGSWTCSGKTFVTSAGLLQLPTNNGATKQLYTWGAFTHNSEAWAYIPGTVRASVVELLRPGIRAALLTWGPGFAMQGVAGTARQIEAMATDGPAAPALREAAGLVYKAAQELGRDRRDYGRGLALLRDAAVQLERARHIDVRLGADVLSQLSSLAKEASADVRALVTGTAAAPGSTEAIARMERQSAEAEALRKRGAHGAAIREFAAAAAIGASSIDWAAPGASAGYGAIGFVGTPALFSAAPDQE